MSGAGDAGAGAGATWFAGTPGRGDAVTSDDGPAAGACRARRRRAVRVGGGRTAAQRDNNGGSAGSRWLCYGDVWQGVRCRDQSLLFADTAATASQWHLGQREMYLPHNRGFAEYFGIPFSCDMGISAWEFSNSSRQPFQARPLPLLNQTTIVEQQTNLATLSRRYVDAALGFIREAQTAAKPFLLYLPWNHVHSPNFALKTSLRHG